LATTCPQELWYVAKFHLQFIEPLERAIASNMPSLLSDINKRYLLFQFWSTLDDGTGLLYSVEANIPAVFYVEPDAYETQATQFPHWYYYQAEYAIPGRIPSFVFSQKVMQNRAKHLRGRDGERWPAPLPVK